MSCAWFPDIRHTNDIARFWLKLHQVHFLCLYLSDVCLWWVIYMIFFWGHSHKAGIRANRNVVTGLSGNTVAYFDWRNPPLSLREGMIQLHKTVYWTAPNPLIGQGAGCKQRFNSKAAWNKGWILRRRLLKASLPLAFKSVWKTQSLSFLVVLNCTIIVTFQLNRLMFLYLYI